MRIEREGDKLHSILFESIIDLEDFENTQNLPNYKEHEQYKNIDSRIDSNYSGKLVPTIHSTKDAIEKSVVGDQELYEQYLKNMISQIESQEITQDHVQHVEVIKRRRVKRGFGNELDIHQVNQGHIDRAWNATERYVADQEHNLITLFIDIGGLWNVDATTTIWNAAVAYKLVDDIEMAGKSVRLLVGGSVSDAIVGSSDNLTTVITVKDYNQSMAVTRVAAMTHIGFHRTVGFAARTTCSKKLVGMLGYTNVVTERLLPHGLQEEIKAGHTKIVLVGRSTSLYSAIENYRSAVAFINKGSC